MAVTADAYSLIVDDPDVAMRVVKEFFGRVGEIKKSSEKSVKSLIHHPDGYDCLVKAKVSRGSRLQLSKRSGDGFVFAIVFKLIREALRVGIPPIFYHDQLYRRTARKPSVAPDDMPELVLPPTLVNAWPRTPRWLVQTPATIHLFYQSVKST